MIASKELGFESNGSSLDDAVKAPLRPRAKLTIFGATGRTGTHLLRRALAAGHAVRVLVRDPSRLTIEHPQLEVQRGDARDPEAIDRAIADSSVVLSALGHTPTSGVDVLTVAASNVVNAARRHGVTRIVALTSGSIPDPRDRPSVGFRCLVWLFTLLFFRRFRDARQQAEVLRNSGLDVVLVRATRLSDEPGTGRIRAGYVGRRVHPTIPREDVAVFMLQQTDSDEFSRRMPMVIRAPAVDA